MEEDDCGRRAPVFPSVEAMIRRCRHRSASIVTNNCRGAGYQPRTALRLGSRLCAMRWSVGLSVLGISSAGAAGDPVATFYKNKTINIVVAGGPDGGYGQYANLIGPFITKYLPGNPTIVTQFMPGGGGITAANYLYNLAPHDGTSLATLLSSLPISERIGRPGIHYSSANFAWIGRFSSLNGVVTVRHDAPATTIEAMKKTPIVVGSAGVQELPILSNWAIGTKFKIISGYEGSQGSVLAYERGEVDAFYTSWDNLKSSYARHLHDLHVLQSGLEAEKGYGDAPLLLDLVTDPEKREVTRFFAAEDTIGRFLVGPPNVPPARVEALRKAFDAAIADPDFLAKATKLNIAAQSGAALQSVVSRVLATPSNIVAMGIQAVGLGAAVSDR
jgi:tripartite-type tricarboxylate transporter receptor subunit TctC